MRIGGVSNIRWIRRKGNVLESEPSLRTSGYNMSLLLLPPSTQYHVFGLEGSELIVCLLKGRVISGHALPLRKSLLLRKGFSLKSSEEGSLLFLCKDEGDNNVYFDDISGLEISWSEYDTDMYRTMPQIHVDEYRINLWYLGPDKHGGIHNHATEPVPFIEFHTQLRGNGWMVKYEDKEGKRESERVEMVRGYTHDLFCSTQDDKVIYPWHEYIAGENGSLFLVFEEVFLR